MSMGGASRCLLRPASPQPAGAACRHCRWHSRRRSPSRLAACAAPATDGTSTVAGLYPFAYVLERVGGPDIHVANLTKPGAEPHDLELTPRQVAAVETAALVVYLPGLQPAVDDAVRTEARHHSLDVAGVVTDASGAHGPRRRVGAARATTRTSGSTRCA